MLEAVIFDMDGVIIDSEPMYTQAAIMALKEYQIEVSVDYLNQFIGSTTHHMCKTIIEDFAIDATPKDLVQLNEKMYRDILNAKGHLIIPYVIDLIKDLHTHGIKLAIASSSSAEAIEEVLTSLSIKEYFIIYVSGDQVALPKPSPDIFLEAARLLEVEPDHCMVIEDSFNGVTAANVAGITSIGYVNPNSGNQDLSKAAMLIEGFEEVDYDFIHQVYQYTHNETLTILSTDRCIIKELSVDDMDDLYQIYKDREVREFLDDMKDNLEVEKCKHQAYIKNVYHFYGYGLWGVYLKETGRLIGRCGIEARKLDGEEVYELGYLLDKAYQGQGYAKEFVSEIIQYCFTKLDIRRIVAVIDNRNLRSIRLAIQVGMHKYGECDRSNRHCYKYEITYS
jgi:HAD superfamily hydrolase (TIGR01509 family)